METVFLYPPAQKIFHILLGGIASIFCGEPLNLWSDCHIPYLTVTFFLSECYICRNQIHPAGQSPTKR